MLPKGLNVTVNTGTKYMAECRYDVKCSICGKLQRNAASHPALYCGDCLRPYVERGRAWESAQALAQQNAA